MKNLLLGIILFCFLIQGCQGQDKSEETVIKNIRPPAVSGRFYPDDPEKLAEALVTILSDESLSRAMGENARAVIANHKPEHSARGFVKAIRHVAGKNNRQKK